MPLPLHVDLVAPREELHYLDSQAISLPSPVEPLEAWDIIMANPLPLLKVAFSIRDAISTRFGVKAIGGFSCKRDGSLSEGDYLDFFLIERLGADILTLTERDHHLDVMTCITARDRDLAITSSVKTHNLFGRAYMVPVGPAHKIIVRAMLARLQRHVAQASSH